MTITCFICNIFAFDFSVFIFVIFQAFDIIFLIVNFINHLKCNAISIITEKRMNIINININIIY